MKKKHLNKQEEQTCDFCHGMSILTPRDSNSDSTRNPLTNSYNIQIMMVSGFNEPDRCTAGLLMAMACATSFKNVVIFLIMDAVELAAIEVPKKVRIEPFDYLDEYIKNLLSLNVKIEVCSSCIKKFYPEITAENSHEFIKPEIKIQGMIEVAFRAKNTPTLMF